MYNGIISFSFASSVSWVKKIKSWVNDLNINDGFNAQSLIILTNSQSITVNSKHVEWIYPIPITGRKTIIEKELTEVNNQIITLQLFRLSDCVVWTLLLEEVFYNVNTPQANDTRLFTLLFIRMFTINFDLFRQQHDLLASHIRSSKTLGMARKYQAHTR